MISIKSQDPNFRLEKFLSSSVMAAILVISSFGPYVIGSIRTEQAMVYGACVVLPFTIANFRRVGFPVVASWLCCILIASLGLVAPILVSIPWKPGSVLAGADNLLLPLAVMLIVWSNVPFSGAATVLRTVGRCVVFLASLNAVVAIASTIFSLDTFLRFFWANSDATYLVAENSQVMGRYSGIFGQPAEAGLMYSVAGLLAIWLYNTKSPVKLYLAIGLVCIGGALSVSKVFLLVGAPLTFWFLWKSRRAVGRLSLFVFGGAISFGVWATGFLQSWDGFEYLIRLLDPPEDSSLVGFYTANRWQDGSNMQAVLNVVMTHSPLSGFGLAGAQVPYDSAWTEIIIYAGALGAAGLCVVFVLLLRIFRRIIDTELRRLALLFWFLLVGASFGLPSLTANRTSTVVWLVISLLCLFASVDSNSQRRNSGSIRNNFNVKSNISTQSSIYDE